jgi:hypothetical protein
MYLYSRCRDDQDDDNACEYTYRYSGNAVTKGTLGMDNLVVGGNLFHGVVFGCSDSSAGGGQSPQASGLVGLGRFMYCLPPPLSRSSGKLVLGVDADAVRNATDRVAVTMSSDERYPSHFYLNLNGVAVGDRTSRGLNRRKATSPAAVAGGDRAHAHGMIVDIASTISSWRSRCTRSSPTTSRLTRRRSAPTSAHVKACGTRVMPVEQVEGLRDPESEGWVPDEGDPPHVWARDGSILAQPSRVGSATSRPRLWGSSPSLR